MKKNCILFFFICALFAVRVAAQDQATIVGTVTDPSGGAVPQAQVTIENPEKGFVLPLSTDAAGEYTAARVPIGNYLITVDAPGFKRVQRSGISLTVGQTLRVGFTLEIGSATQSVTVVGNAPQVNTENGTVSNLITGQQITELNLNNRNFTNLVLLSPGAAPSSSYDPTTMGIEGSDQVSINGIEGNFNNFEYDGVTILDQGNGASSLLLFPSLDAIAEFRVSNSNYSAEYSKTAGSMIELASKSGTNKFHGDLYDYLRNDILDANDWFANRQILSPGQSSPKTPLKWNDFGFTFGGPFYIPGHYNTGKSKTFFFVSEEWRRQRQGTVINSQAPTALMRNGDFSQCDPASSNYNVVVASGCQLPIDPTTNQPFPGDVVPIDPNAQDLLNSLVPLPNNGIDGYTKAPSLPTNFREDSVRVDQNISDKVRIFARYTQDAYEQNIVPSLWSGSSYGTVRTKMGSIGRQATFHMVTAFKPNLMNEFVASFSVDYNPISNSLGFDSPAGSINKPSNWSAQNIFPANQTVAPELPAITVCGGLPFCFSESPGFPFLWRGPEPSIKDNLVWTVGKHIWKFGFYWTKTQADTSTNIGQLNEGSLTFANWSSVTTGNALADMYLGRIASYTEYGRLQNGQPFGGIGYLHSRQNWDFEPYIEDEWHLRPNLTLNIGLRYYFLTSIYDATNPTQDSIFLPNLYDPTKQAQLDANGNLIAGSGATYLNYGNGMVQCGTGGLNKGCLDPYHGTLSPRFSFSWDPTGKGETAVSGGYGLVYGTGTPLEIESSFNGNPPSTTSMSGYNIVGYQNIHPGPITPGTFTNIPIHTKWPEIHQFNLGIQHEFPGNNILDVRYVGNVGRHLALKHNMNQIPIGVGEENVPALAGTTGCDAAGNCDVQQILMNDVQPNIFFVPYRGYSSMTMLEYGGNSNYSSLQVAFRHSVGHGLTLQTAYTWSHTLDNIICSDNGGCAYSGINDYDLHRWYGNSSLDLPQVLAMSFTYQLPFFAGTRKLPRGILHGWELSGITTFATGTPLNFHCGIAGMSSGIGGAVQCNSLGPVRIKKGVVNDPEFGPTPTWFDPGAIGQVTLDQLPANNQPGMFGDMGKYTLIGPGRNDWDVALHKEFRLPWLGGEHSTLQLRWETFNTFNHPQWNSVSIGCSSLTPPGQPCNGSDNIGNAEVAGAYPPRIMQFGLKVIF